MITGRQPDSGKPTVRDERGACGNVGYGRGYTGTYSGNAETAKSGPKVARAAFLPDSLESGLLAARTIIEAQGDYCPKRLAPYMERLRRRFGRGPSLAAAIPAGLRTLLAPGLFSHPRLLRRVVLEHGFLHTKQPALTHIPIAGP